MTAHNAGKRWDAFAQFIDLPVVSLKLHSNFEVALQINRPAELGPGQMHVCAGFKRGSSRDGAT